MIKRSVPSALAIIATFLVINVSAAEEASPISDQVPEADLKELTDPTILVRRVWFEEEWNHFDDSTNIVEDTFGGQWAWPVGANQDWAVRLKLPVKYRFGSDTPGVSDIFGLGDVKIATGTAFRLSKTWRIGAGLDLEMPTGRHELSDNAWRIQEFLALGWDITPWLSISPSTEYNQSIAAEGGYADINFLETFVPFTFLLPEKWAIAIGYENKTDFENDNEVTNRGKILVAKELEHVPLSFALSAKREFNGGPKEVQVNFVVTWFFR